MDTTHGKDIAPYIQEETYSILFDLDYPSFIKDCVLPFKLKYTSTYDTSEFDEREYMYETVNYTEEFVKYQIDFNTLKYGNGAWRSNYTCFFYKEYSTYKDQYDDLVDFYLKRARINGK
jgi:hypothetical protein